MTMYNAAITTAKISSAILPARKKGDMCSTLAIAKTLEEKCSEVPARSKGNLNRPARHG